MANDIPKEIKDFTANKDNSFVLFRLPDSHQIEMMQLTNLYETSDWSNQEGFVFHPFQSSPEAHPLLLRGTSTHYPIKHFSTSKAEAVDRFQDLLSDEKEKKHHIKLVKQAIQVLKSKELSKVVLARKIKVNKPSAFNTLNTFIRLSMEYPKNFSYYLHISGRCQWIGSTPEQLIKRDSLGMETTSLAGTIEKDSKQSWRKKESQEQEMVSDYIEQVLRKFELNDFQKEAIKEKDMGKVVHLLTRYKIKAQPDNSSFQAFLAALHPTPAVSGFPKQKAIDYITDEEPESRRYYAGYLGPINKDNTTELFVNLRCLEVTDDELQLYAGGGITALSDAEEEWIETCMKANTILSLI